MIQHQACLYQLTFLVLAQVRIATSQSDEHSYGTRRIYIPVGLIAAVLVCILRCFFCGCDSDSTQSSDNRTTSGGQRSSSVVHDLEAPTPIEVASVPLIAATANKKGEHDKFGIVLGQHADGTIVVSEVKPDGLFHDTPIKVGDVLFFANDEMCFGKDVSSVASVLREEKNVTFLFQRSVAEPITIEATTLKRTKETGCGIVFKKISTGALIVADVYRDGLFQNSSIDVGDECLSVNGVSCDGKDSKSVAEMVREVDGNVCLVARRFQKDMIAVVLRNEQFYLDLGIKFEEDSNGKKLVSQISIQSPFHQSQIKHGDELVSMHPAHISSGVYQSIFSQKTQIEGSRLCLIFLFEPTKWNSSIVAAVSTDSNFCYSDSA